MLQTLLKAMAMACRDSLGSHLVGVYLHGSLAFGCFRWERSDVDFIVVVQDDPPPAAKQALLTALLYLEEQGPPKGLEMSVVLEEHCRRFVYPTPFVLHYSPVHRAACLADLPGYGRRMRGTDRDLAAHFAVIREAGITLCGRDRREVFGAVPPEAFLDSVRADLEEAAGRIEACTADAVLNACRTLACYREGSFLSKEQGGLWALGHLPVSCSPVIQAALKAYQGGKEGHVDTRMAAALVRDALDEIHALL